MTMFSNNLWSYCVSGILIRQRDHQREHRPSLPVLVNANLQIVRLRRWALVSNLIVFVARDIYGVKVYFFCADFLSRLPCDRSCIDCQVNCKFASIEVVFFWVLPENVLCIWREAART